MPIVKQTSSYVPPPAGTHYARCCAVIDLGTQPDERYGPRPKVMLMWELPHERVKFDENGQEKERPQMITKEYTASLGKKADLRKHLDAWRGKPFTEDELKGFELGNVLNVPCLLTVMHEAKDGGGIRAKIASVSGVPKGTAVPELYHKPLSFDLIDGRESDNFKTLPEWIQEKLGKCAEWSGAHPTESEPTGNGHGETDPTMDEVPF